MFGPSYVGFKAYDMGFDAHLTVCYFGDKASGETVASINKILANPKWQGPAYVARKGLDFFGPNNDIAVLKVAAPMYMWELRSELEQFSASEWGWNPHITLELNGPETICLPAVIKLDKLGVY